MYVRSLQPTCWRAPGPAFFSWLVSFIAIALKCRAKVPAAATCNALRTGSSSKTCSCKLGLLSSWLEYTGGTSKKQTQTNRPVRAIQSPPGDQQAPLLRYMLQPRPSDRRNLLPRCGPHKNRNMRIFPMSKCPCVRDDVNQTSVIDENNFIVLGHRRGVRDPPEPLPRGLARVGLPPRAVPMSRAKV